MGIPSLKSIRKERCERSLMEYTKDAWKVLEPATPYIHSWHVEAIAEYLTAIKQGQIKRLLINMPPRLMKTMECTIMFPSWLWIDAPHTKFIKISYSDMLSKGHNIKTRDLIQSHWYQSNWGDKYQLKHDLNTQRKFENDRTGVSFSTSVGGTMTGEGADIIIFDDPHNPKKAESDAEREEAVEFFKSTLQTRLNNPKTGAIIVVMQRLHDQDVSGHILASNSGYEHLCLPMEAEEKTIFTFPISKKQIIREKGDLLQPERYDKEILSDMKKQMGSYAYSGQMQQEPTPKGGGMFKKWWWRYWKPEGMDLPPVRVKNENGEPIFIEAEPLPKEFDDKAQSWDMNFKKKKGNDKVACGVWKKKGANKYWIHRENQQIGFTETLTLFRKVTNAYPDVIRKLVEDKANGPAVIDSLKNEISGIIEYNPGADSKEARAEAVTPEVEAGNVYLPHPLLYDWVDEVIEIAAKFPKVAHDDDIDQLSQILNYWRAKVEPRIRRL